MINRISLFNSQSFVQFSNTINRFIVSKNVTIAAVALLSLACIWIAKRYSLLDLKGRVKQETPKSESHDKEAEKLDNFCKKLKNFQSDEQMWKALEQEKLEGWEKILVDKLLQQNPRPTKEDLQRELQINFVKDGETKILNGFLLSYLLCHLKNLQVTKPILDTHVSCEDFQALIDYLLFDKTDLSVETAKQVFVSAHYFNCKNVRQKARLALINHAQEINLTCTTIQDFEKYKLEMNDLMEIGHQACKGLKKKCREFFKMFFMKFPLEELDLTNYRALTDQDVLWLCESQKLRKLNLSGCFRITDASLSSLGKLSQLKELNLDGCEKITDRGMDYLLQGCKELQVLIVNRCKKLTNQVLKSVGQMKNLITLGLSACELISDEGLCYLVKGCQKLKNLDVSGCKNLTNNFFESTVEFPALERLELILCTQFKSVGFVKLKECKNLISLNLSYCNVTDGNIACLKDCKKLKILDFSQCYHLTDKTLEWVSLLPELEELDLTGCAEITADGIAYLEKCKKLTSLTLDFSNSVTTTNKVLDNLGKIESLKEIRTVGIEKIQNRRHPTLQKVKLLESNGSRSPSSYKLSDTIVIKSD